jgi:hypothetical protein
MLTIELAIADYNEAYLGALTKFLITYEQVTFLIHRFSELSEIASFIQDNPGTMIIMDFQVFKDLLKSDSPIKNQPFMILVDELVDSQLNQYHLISKYEKGGSIANSISKKYAEISPKEIPKIVKDSTPVISITQFQNSCDPLGHSIAKHILAFEKRVLYISFDILSSPPDCVVLNGKNTLSDIIYYMKKDPTKVGLMLEAIKSSDISGFLDYIPACLYGNHLWDLSEDELNDLLDYLIKYLSYDVIIVDLDNNCSKHNMTIMKKCHHNLLVSSNEEHIEQRMKHFSIQPEIKKMTNIVSIKIVHLEHISAYNSKTNLEQTIQFSFPYNNNNVIEDTSYVKLVQTLINEVVL